MESHARKGCARIACYRAQAWESAVRALENSMDRGFPRVSNNWSRDAKVHAKFFQQAPFGTKPRHDYTGERTQVLEKSDRLPG